MDDPMALVRMAAALDAADVVLWDTFWVARLDRGTPMAAPIADRLSSGDPPAPPAVLRHLELAASIKPEASVPRKQLLEEAMADDANGVRIIVDGPVIAPAMAVQAAAFAQIVGEDWIDVGFLSLDMPEVAVVLSGQGWLMLVAPMGDTPS